VGRESLLRRREEEGGIGKLYLVSAEKLGMPIALSKFGPGQKEMRRGSNMCSQMEGARGAL